MMLHTFHTSLARLALTTAAVLIASLTLHAQEDPQGGGARGGGRLDDVVLDPATLTVRRYTPEHVEIHELANVLQRSFGRSFRLTSRATGERTQNIQQIGETLLLIDTPDMAQQLVSVIGEIDVPSNAGDARTMRSFHPRHVTASQTAALIEAAGGVVMRMDESRAPVLVGRGTEAQMRDAAERLAELDVAPQRLMLECLVIRGTNAPVDADLAAPAELTTNLSKLVGIDHFEIVTRGLLTAVAERRGKLMIELPNEELPCQMRFEIGNHDKATGELALSECEMVIGNQGLVTSARARPGEYLVLGATGQTPVFAVLRMTPLD